VPEDQPGRQIWIENKSAAGQHSMVAFLGLFNLVQIVVKVLLEKTTVP